MLFFFILQILQTVLNKNHWPFCSYNMFNVIVPMQATRIKINLCESNGTRQTVVPGKVLPLDFFIAKGIISRIYDQNQYEEEKIRFSLLILEMLNKKPWVRFDERMKSASPIGKGGKFVSFEIIKCFENYDSYPKNKKMKLVSETIIYSFGSK
jgi:hypothetical protein